MATLTEELGSLRQDINALKDEVTGTGDEVGLGVQAVGEVRPENRTNVIIHNSLSSDTFVISDPLGKNQLNGNFKLVSSVVDAGLDSRDWKQVINKDNTFEENFDLTTFTDSTNSTGTTIQNSTTLVTTYEIESGEVLQSELVALYPSTTYTKATLTIEGSTSGASLSLSGDGGSTWESATNGTEHTFTTATTAGIKYKVEATGGTTFPMTFPFTFTAANTVTLTGTKLKYS